MAGFLWILRSMHDGWRRGGWRLTFRMEQLESKKPDGNHHGGTANQDDCQAPGVGLLHG
jgi:hypothetical protein